MNRPDRTNGQRVAVVGGGITGLAAAHRLREIGIQTGREISFSLLEAEQRLGGVISSRKEDGFLLEAGPDSFITDRPGVLRLAERLGIQDRMIPTRPEHARSFVVRKGKLHPTPAGFYLIAPSRLLPFLTTPILSLKGKFRAGLDLLIPRRKSTEDESIGNFVIRRLGQEALDRLAQPMIAAIYGGDPMHLSLLATFPRFRRMEEEHGSVIRALWAAARRRSGADRSAATASGPRYGLFMSFDTGLQLLVETLRHRIPPETIRTGTAVEKISPAPGGGWRLRLRGSPGPEERFDALILALPGPPTARLAQSFDPGLGNRIAEIPYGPSTTVSLGFRKTDIEHKMDGFGFVIPAQEGFRIRGCTFCHRKYPARAPEGSALLRAFHDRLYSDLSDEELVEKTREELARLLGIRGEPILARVARYPGGLPHYPVGHRLIVTNIRDRVERHPGLALAGNAYGGVGIPDCVQSGESAADAVAGYLAQL